MQEELLKNGYLDHPAKKIGTLNYYSLGETTINTLEETRLIKSKAKKYKRKKPDALITDDEGNVIAFIEHKDPAAFRSASNREETVRQEIGAAQSIHSAVFIATDTQKTVWVNPKTGNEVLDTTGNPLQMVFDPFNNERKLESLLHYCVVSLTSENDALLEESSLDPSDLARSIHQTLWVSKNTSPETSLYTFVELFLFKYLSDLKVLKGDYSFESLMSKYEDNSEEYVLDFYLGPQGPRERIKTLFPVGEDQATVVNGDIFHSEKQADGTYLDNGDGSVFHNLLRQFQAYEKSHGKFLNINLDFKSRLFESFLKDETDKKKMGQFFTPLKVVRQITRMAEIHSDMSICDPACGVGKFLLEAVSDDIDSYFKMDGEKLVSNIKLTGYDKASEDSSDRTIILAKANLLIYFSRFLQVQHNEETIRELSKLINSTFRIWRDTLGSLGRNDEEMYDLILTNPPYVVNGSGTMKQQAIATGRFKCNGLGLEALFCEWIVKALKPKGHAYVVIPDGILQNLPNGRLREFILSQTYLRAILSLPLNTFYGTPKKTYIIALEKRGVGETGPQTSPVFACLCASIGETLDVNRFAIDDNDLETGVGHFLRFRATNYSESFEPVIREDDGTFVIDGKCKLLPASYFMENCEDGWYVDEQWSDDEKIALGFKKPSSVVSIDEFNEIIDTAIDQLNQYKEDLQCLL